MCVTVRSEASTRQTYKPTFLTFFVNKQNIPLNMYTIFFNYYLKLKKEYSPLTMPFRRMTYFTVHMPCSKNGDFIIRNQCYGLLCIVGVLNRGEISPMGEILGIQGGNESV